MCELCKAPASLKESPLSGLDTVMDHFRSPTFLFMFLHCIDFKLHGVHRITQTADFPASLICSCDRVTLMLKEQFIQI